MRYFARFKQSRKIAELGCQNVLWTDRKHGFLNRLVQKLGFILRPVIFEIEYTPPQKILTPRKVSR